MYKKIVLALMLAVSLTSCSQEVVHNLNGCCEPVDFRKQFDRKVNLIVISLFTLIDVAIAPVNTNVYRMNDKYAIGVYSRFLFALLEYIRKLEPELLLEYDQLVERL